MKDAQSLTIGELIKALQRNRFILARFIDGDLVGINSGVLKILCKKPFDTNQQTNYTSFKPCSFIEYINYKTPFL